MEGLKKRVWIFAGVLVLWGGLLQFQPNLPRTMVRSALAAVGVKSTAIKVPPEHKNEEWMVANSPRQIGAYQYEPGRDNPEVSYKMDEGTYDTLKPWGIVARRFRGDDKVFDAVLIASESKDSFHDPRVCFTAQQFNIDKETVDMVQTQTRGTIPVTLAEMSSKEGKTLTVFFYRGPGGFYPTTQDLKKNMFIHQCKTMEDPQGVFYRFIAMYPGANKADLFKFIGEFLDKSGETSGGFF